MKPHNHTETTVGKTTSIKRLRLPPIQFNPKTITHTQPKQYSLDALFQSGIPQKHTRERYQYLWKLHEAIHQEVTEEFNNTNKNQEENQYAP